jgi:4-amino-4-deoxy-L-arabinose transferase-like glycosyltransferase
MGIKSQPVNLTKSWIARHPFIVIGVILAVCLVPFLNKAVHTDDALFVWTAEQIQRHPLDFFGFKVNWWVSAVPMWVANYNPPLMSYYLAGVAAVFGWSEIVLHLAGLAVAFAAATGIYALARRWCERPLPATLIAVFTPAFLVSSTTLMCDVLMLSFWVWALVFWERALANERNPWPFVGAGALAGLAVLTKFSAVTLLPLLPILAGWRTRKWGWWVAGVATPLLMVAGYEWLTAGMYGRGLFSVAAHYAQTHRFQFPGGWKAKGIIGLAFAGGSLLPALFFAPWLWRQRTLLAGGIVILGLGLGMFRLGDKLGLIHPWGNPESLNHPDFLLQVVLLTAAGLHLLLLTLAEAWQRRDIISAILALWIGSGLLFAVGLNWTMSARSFLPLAPAVAILLVRRLTASGKNWKAFGWWALPLAPAAAISLSLVTADYELANSRRAAAGTVAAKYKTADQQLWFVGHGAFQYYLEKLGGHPIDVEQSILQPGDIVAAAVLGGDSMTFPVGSLEWSESMMYQPWSWMDPLGGNERRAAGFYDANWGPVPFALGGFPPQVYFIVKVSSRVQFHSQPANPQEVRRGAVPSYTNVTPLTDEKLILRQNPEATRQIQMAWQLEAEGRLAEAIQHYRQAVNADTNSPLALNNLAWVLATTDHSELRNGEVAVQLAERAYELTGGTRPAIITTLAAAYAETDRFPEAIHLIRIAHHLAMLTGQTEVTELDSKLLDSFIVGHAVEMRTSP